MSKTRANNYILNRYGYDSRINTIVNKVNEVFIDGKAYYLYYVPADFIKPFFGYAHKNIAVINNSLSSKTKNFVKKHELYHCTDKTFLSGGWFGKEVRATFFPALKDPLGFFSTTWDTISSLDRLKLYYRRLTEGW